MALRWTVAGMVEAAKSFHRLKAYKQLPILKAALEKHRDPETRAPVDLMAEAIYP
jgi:putative transposase